MVIQECYRFEERKYNDGIFSKKTSKGGQAIDATYIIYLEGNGRLPKINEELNKLHPTNQLWILHNKGYRVCQKEDHINNPAADLNDCYYQVFRHAAAHGYENILVLEDDFFFDETFVKEPENANLIIDFIIEKRNADFMYLLGCLPILQIPIGEHRRTISLGTHAVIYSRKCMERVLLSNQKNVGDWDVWHNLHTQKYMFYKPLCYQLFPQTANQNGWLSNYLPELIQTVLLLYFIIPCLQCLSLDKSITPGYSFFYTFSEWIFSYLIGFLTIYLLYKFFMINYYRK